MISAEDKKIEKDKMVSRKVRIQTIAIIFLAFMLVLTFFSNTIMNRALTEVSTQQIYADVLTNKVRGSGVVEAGQVYYVSIKESRRIQTMNVKLNQEVNTGDILFVLSETDSEELSAAKKELESAEVAYEGSVLTAGLTVAERESIESGEIGSLSDRQNKLAQAQNLADAAAANMDAVQREIDLATADSDTGSSSTDTASIKDLEEQLEMKLLDHSIDGLKESHDEAAANLETAQSEYNKKEETYNSTISEIEKREYSIEKIDKKLPKQKEKVDEAKTEYDSAKTAYDNAESAVENAEFSLEKAQANLADYVFVYVDGDGVSQMLTGEEAYKKLDKWYGLYRSGAVIDPVLYPFASLVSADVLENAHKEVYNLKSAVTSAEARVKSNKKALELASEKLESAKSKYTEATTKYDGMITEKETLNEEIEDLNHELGVATADVIAADSALDKAQSNYDTINKQYNPLINQKSELTYASDLRKLQEQIDALESAAEEEVEKKAKAEELKKLQLKLTEAKLNKELKDKDLEELKSLLATQLSLGTEFKNIKTLRKKVKLLKTDSCEKEVTAPVSGIITEILLSAGQTITPNENIIAIQPENEDFTIKFDVTAAQARRVQPGDDATILNNWSANDLKARVKAIQPNKTDKTMSTLVIQISGDVVVGNSYTVSVGTSSTSYDYIVPTSSIREDSNGKFIYTIESKSTPLGNRYYARRTDVEVLASDDTKSAISAVLDDNSYVITTTAKPIVANEQVRLTDE